jgi:hypothetical protein
MIECSVEACHAKHYGRGYCSRHYQRFWKHGNALTARRLEGTGDPYRDLLLRGVTRSGECLISNVPKDAKGYAVMRTQEKFHKLHRVSYERWHGPIPAGLLVDHICHNEAALRGECMGGNSCAHRGCVNPGHLRAVTTRENWASSPLTMSAMRKSRTHCIRNHPYDETNTKIRPDGARECRECKRINHLERKASRA